MDWSKGFTSSFYAYVMDPITWRETERLEIIGGRISRGGDGLRDAADIDITGGIDSGEKWIRVYMDVVQSGGSAHIPLFTGLTSMPERNIEGSIEENTLQCFSILKPAQDILLERGFYVPGDISGAVVIESLLSVTPANVIVLEEAPSLQSSIVAEEGETNLSMIEKILDAINWRMRLQGDGTIELLPKSNEEVARLSPLDNDIIEPSITVERDWFSCPNVFRAIYNDISAVARDDNPESPLSTVARGREIWAEEDNAELNTGEGIAEYARRKLKELQQVSEVLNYDRRFRPDIFVGDIINLHYPEQRIEGKYIIESQEIEIGYGAKTGEEVKRYE